jgi:hypothetical protein
VTCPPFSPAFHPDRNAAASISENVLVRLRAVDATHSSAWRRGQDREMATHRRFSYSAGGFLSLPFF